jgi:ABC-type nickel/cobalt efflux system permease component RcnA
MSRWLLLFIVLPCVMVVKTAVAHPMGNFSINHYAALLPGDGELRLVYHLDIAELPTVEEMRSLDANRDGVISDGEKSAYLARKGAALTAGLSLKLNGRTATLSVSAADLQIRPGAAGLPILLISLEYHVPLDRASQSVLVEYDDENYLTRTGWREVIANARGGWKIMESDVPHQDVSNGLLNYPADLIAAPPQVTSSRLVIEPGVFAAESVVSAGLASAQGSDSAATPRDRFTQLITVPRISPGFLIVALGISFALGAAHAMAPGHGKTVLAAYLVGSRGTARHAMLLGGVVTATHVAGIFLLGIMVLLLSKYVVPERLYPWLSFSSGMMIFIVGVQQFVLRSAGLRGAVDDSHDPSRGGHIHALPERISLGNLVAMGVSGGMVPCPSALVVLLGAIALGRTGLGLVLIVAFSIGLATVLISLGVGAVHARKLLSRFRWEGASGTTTAWLTQRLPLLSSAAVALLGLGIAVQAILSAAGISKP